MMRGQNRETQDWDKLLEQTHSDAAHPTTTTQPQPAQSHTPTVSSSPLVRAASEYDAAQRAHRVAVATLQKVQEEELSTREEEERAHMALIEAVAQIAKGKQHETPQDSQQKKA
jgi:hypothetical protein